MASGVVRSVLRGLGALVALGLSVAAVLLIVFGHDSRSVRVGVILAAWGLLIGFGIYGPRRSSHVDSDVAPVGPGTALEVRGAGAAARREFEASLQALLRREVERTMHVELSGLHSEVAELRGEVRDALRNQVSLERVETRIVGANLTSLQDDLERRLAADNGPARLPAPAAPPADITQEIRPGRAIRDEPEVVAAESHRPLGRPGRAASSPSSISIPATPPPVSAWVPPAPASVATVLPPPPSPSFPMPEPVVASRPAPAARPEPPRPAPQPPVYEPPAPPATFIPPPAPQWEEPDPPTWVPETTVAQQSDLRSLRRNEPASNGAAAQFFNGAARSQPLPTVPAAPEPRPAPVSAPPPPAPVEPIRWPWMDDPQPPPPPPAAPPPPAWRPVPQPAPRPVPQPVAAMAQPATFDHADPFAGLPRLTPADELDLPEPLPDLPPAPPPAAQPPPPTAQPPPPAAQPPPPAPQQWAPYPPAPYPPGPGVPPPLNGGRHANAPGDGDIYVGRRRR